MVRGIKKFREYFEENIGQYIMIGGTACDIVLGRLGEEFRQTKDLDIVLIVKALDDSFVERFVAFVEEGGYQHIHKGTGENQFYRFEKPDNMEFPYMIELFSRRPAYLQSLDIRLAPIHISDDVISLSAILLDDEYYALLTEGIVTVEGISALNLEYLILFKIKAWLDLNDRKAKGEKIDSKNIKKHKNDILRLAANIQNGANVEIIGQVKVDVRKFLEIVEKDVIDVKTLGIRGTTYQEVIDAVKKCYLLK